MQPSYTWVKHVHEPARLGDPRAAVYCRGKLEVAQAQSGLEEHGTVL
jgi:hypothetical protein